MLTRADDTTKATGWVLRLEQQYSERLSVSRLEARREIARADSNLSEGALEGLARGRVKDVSTRVYRALNSLVVDELTTQMHRIERELDAAKRSALDHETITRAEAALDAARSYLKDHRA